MAGAEGPAPRPPAPPPALAPGDTIALVAPAGLVDERRLQDAARHLERRGYKVRIQPNVLGREGYLAGDDAARARDLAEAFADDEVKMILCVRGGYGSPRILDRFDFAKLRAQPKIFVGYSDATALLVALEQKAGMVVFHGPMALGDFSGRGGLPAFSARHFWPLLEAPRAEEGKAAANGREGELASLSLDWGRAGEPRGILRRTLAPGTAEGRLCGGNLSTIAALLGTPYEIQTRGRILFLEDVNEEPFRIDRMLNQLRLAGKLQAASGILLGVFVRCDERRGESLSLEEVFAHYLAGLKIPVLAGFPAGHLPEQATLPMGLRVRLEASAQRLVLLEPAVAPARPASAATVGGGR